MSIDVQRYNSDWADQFGQIADTIRPAIEHIPNATIEHVGSTSVPGLAAKPIIDIDIIVDANDLPAGIAALESIGYAHRGDLGVPGREAFHNPDGLLDHHLYLCERGCLSLRNHRAVRAILRQPPDRRDDYAAVKLALAADPTMNIDTYIDGKSAVLQKILALSDDITAEERKSILGVNAQTLPPHTSPPCHSERSEESLSSDSSNDHGAIRQPWSGEQIHEVRRCLIEPTATDKRHHCCSEPNSEPM
jgi:GrpB-like predicted nucleotidyltransferase (UPF0157 family)